MAAALLGDHKRPWRPLNPGLRAEPSVTLRRYDLTMYRDRHDLDDPAVVAAGVAAYWVPRLRSNGCSAQRRSQATKAASRSQDRPDPIDRLSVSPVSCDPGDPHGLPVQHGARAVGLRALKESLNLWRSSWQR